MEMDSEGFLGELRKLIENKIRSVSLGEHIRASADQAENCLVVFTGTVEERHTSISGRYTVSRVYRDGHVILPSRQGPEGWDQVSRVASSACEIGELRVDRFWNCLSEQTLLMRHFLGQCIHDLDHMMLRLVDVNLATVRERIRRELLRRVDLLGPGDGKIEIRSHDEFAAYLGANRETVSREIARFSRLGVIETSRGHIVVKDPELLRTVS